MRLLPLETWIKPVAGPLLPQLRSRLAAAARAEAGAGASPLRWAITAADPGRGLRIEAVLVVEEVTVVKEGPAAMDPPCDSAIGAPPLSPSGAGQLSHAGQQGRSRAGESLAGTAPSASSPPPAGPSLEC